MLLVIPLSLVIVMAGMWLMTTQLVKAVADANQQAVRVIASAISEGTGQAVRSAVEAVTAVMGPVVPEQVIEGQDVDDRPPWEQWGEVVDGENRGADPLDRFEPDPESWRQDAVGVSPGFQFDPRQPDLSGEAY